MLSDILNPDKEDPKKKEVKFKEEPKKEEKGKIDDVLRKLRLSKKLEQAKRMRQNKEEKSKFVKSDVISQKAAALEKKISQDK